MSLPPQTRLGPYQVIESIGAGGMGEVYRARDTRLGRDVALKVLPPHLASDREFVQRFEQEARLLGSLSHPNLTVVHDVGREGDLHFLVTELLEGETLGGRLERGSLGVRRAIEVAAQIAQGLAAAHERGIVHRDLKPGNVFLTRDGRVKLLDFGLARQLVPEAARPGGSGSDPDGTPTCEFPAEELRTRAGMVMGTVAYMSPEQVRGQGVDSRTDIFSFGILLYEMLAGQRPFRGDSAVETMNAILKEEPPDLALSQAHLAPALERIVRHCLEKRPESRFQSARDLAFDLEALGAPSGSQPIPARRSWRRLGFGAGAAALLLLVASVAYFLGGRGRTADRPRFLQQTYRQGIVTSARFTDGGRNLVYSAHWRGEDAGQIYTARTGSPESRSLGLGNTRILSVSPSGEMALLLHPRDGGMVEIGTLALAPQGGGAPKPVAENIQDADWAPDGRALALIRQVDGRSRIEFPLGTVRAEAKGDGWYSHLRFHPDGRRLACIFHPIARDDRGLAMVLDLKDGRSRTVGPEWSTSRGIVWAPDGRSLWISAREFGVSRALYEVSPSGSTREILQVPMGCAVADVAPDGRILFYHEQNRIQVAFWGKDDPRPRDLSWLNYSLLMDIARDGSALLISEGGTSAGPEYDIYLRPTSGDPPVKVGPAVQPVLSPDQRWVLGRTTQFPARLRLMPTGPGEIRTFELKLPGPISFCRWLPDSSGWLLVVTKEMKPTLFLQGLGESEPRSLALPEGWQPSRWILPDGQRLVLWRAGAGETIERVLWDMTAPDKPLGPVTGIVDKERILALDPDGIHLFTGQVQSWGLQITRVHFLTGQRQPWRDVRLGVPLDPARCLLASDGRGLAFTVEGHTSDLFLVEGVR